MGQETEINSTNEAAKMENKRHSIREEEQEQGESEIESKMNSDPAVEMKIITRERQGENRTEKRSNKTEGKQKKKSCIWVTQQWKRREKGK